MLMQGTHKPVTAMRVIHEHQPLRDRLAPVDKRPINK